MSGFERYTPARRGRPARGLYARLGVTDKTIVLRVTRAAVLALGVDPRQGDHLYLLIDVDRSTGEIRLTPTDNVYQGRLLNPTNLQMSLGHSFREWTGWGESRWELHVEDGALVGPTREHVVGGKEDS